MTKGKQGQGIRNKTLEILCGGTIPDEVPRTLELIRAAVDDPDTLTNTVQTIVDDPTINELRWHLVRMQVESEIRMREDVDRHAKRLWVAQTIERLAFGELRLEGTKHDSDEDDED